MSRIGKLPITIPGGVTAKWEEPLLKVKGPQGELTVEVKPPCGLTVEDGVIRISRPDDTRESKRAQGLYRSLANNAVTGVAKGFEKKLEIVGVGYKAEVAGPVLKLSLGFAFVKEEPIPEGVKVRMEGPALVISGADRQKVGDFAATVRAYRPPEPYKGKGVKYAGEQIKRKAGKAAVGGTK